MSAVHVTRGTAPIELVTVELTEAEARAILRVLDSDGRETVADARLKADDTHGMGWRIVTVKLRKALT